MHTGGHIHFRRALFASHKGWNFITADFGNHLTGKSTLTGNTGEPSEIIMHIKNHGLIIHTPIIIGKLET